MAKAILNLDAFRHNTQKTAEYAQKWGVKVLPVLKGIHSHPLAVRELLNAGFQHFGYAEFSEPITHDESSLQGQNTHEKVLIQICPPSMADRVAKEFTRSFQTDLQTLQNVSKAAVKNARHHEVTVMIDVGEKREGISPDSLSDFLDFALTLDNIAISGFGLTLGCLGNCLPGGGLVKTLDGIRQMFHSKGIQDPKISVGGSVFCQWIEDFGPQGITEIRLGANFILGTDTYRKCDLPGGPFRTDVCLLEGEILEVEERLFDRHFVPELPDLDGCPVITNTAIGQRRCALLDVGLIHAKPEELVCLLPQSTICGICSNYLVLDVTDCPAPVKPGQKVLFHIGYWSIARIFNSTLVPVLPVDDQYLHFPLTGKSDYHEKK